MRASRIEAKVRGRRAITMSRRAIAAVMAVALTGWLLPAGAAPLPYEWRRTVGLSLADVATDDTGFTVVTGEFQLDEDHRGFLVAAFDAYGAKLWQDTWQPLSDLYAGTMGDSVTIGPDCNVYAVGFGWHCRFGCESGGWFIRSYARDGTLRWTRQAAGWKTRPRQSKATGIDSWSGGVVISGYEYDDMVGPTDSWIRAYGLDGGLSWKTRVDVRGGTELRESAMDVAVGRNGGVFVTGGVEPDVGGDASDRDPFVASFDPQGERRWTRVLLERRDRDHDIALSLDARSGTVVVGGVLGNHIAVKLPPPHLGWVARLSFMGDIRWVRSWGREHPQDVEGVTVSPSGAVVTVGGLQSADHSFALTMRMYSPAGDLLASQVIDPAKRSLVGYSVSIGEDGTSLVGTLFDTAYVHETSGVDGRLWRL